MLRNADAELVPHLGNSSLHEVAKEDVSDLLLLPSTRHHHAGRPARLRKVVILQQPLLRVRDELLGLVTAERPAPRGGFTNVVADALERLLRASCPRAKPTAIYQR